MPHTYSFRAPKFENSAVELDLFGENCFTPNEKVPPHTHGHFEFVLATKGTFMHMVEHRDFILDEGNLCIIRPGELHSVRGFGEGPWTIVWVSTIVHGPDDIVQLLMSRREPIIHGCLHLEPMFRSLMEEARRPKAGMVAVLGSIAVQLVASIARLVDAKSPAPPEPRMSGLVTDARDYIEAAPRYGMALDEIAKELHVSISWLSHKFQEEMGISVRGHLRRILIHRAKRLLEDPSVSITEVADTLGFTSLSCFATFFKRETGSSPSGYRRAFLGT